MYKKYLLIAFILFSTSVRANWNIKFPTTGGKLLWTDVKIVNDWRIQKNLLTGHFRLLNPKKVRYRWGSMQSCTESLNKHTVINRKKKVAVLIHGLGLRKESLKCLAPLLQKEGFQTIQFGYGAMLEPLERCADKLHSVLEEYEGEKYFITHSMGGILLRLYQQKYNTEIEKAVLLAPPNKGAQIVDSLKKLKLAGLLGVNGKRLHTDCDGLPQSLPGLNTEYMTVAGTKKSYFGYFPLMFFMKEQNDGVVSTESTKMEGEVCHLKAAAYHLKIMKNKSVQKALIEFLTN